MDLAVDADEALRDDRSHFAAGQGILQAVAEEDGDGELFVQLMRTD